MLKITSIADTHTRHNEVHFDSMHLFSDLLVHAGDFTNSGQDSEHYVKSFLDWFSSQPQKYKIFTGGNHDFFAHKNPGEFRKLLPSNVMFPENDSVTIEGYKIFVSPIVVDMKGWAFSKTSDEAKVIWDRIPDDTQILITHTPPKGILDADRRGNHHGCKHLADRIEELKKLRLHIFGHVHSKTGSIERRGRKFINASVYNGNDPSYFEFDKK